MGFFERQYIEPLNLDDFNFHTLRKLGWVKWDFKNDTLKAQFSFEIGDDFYLNKETIAEECGVKQEVNEDDDDYDERLRDEFNDLIESKLRNIIEILSDADDAAGRYDAESDQICLSLFWYCTN